VQQGEPLTYEQLEEIIKVIRTSLSEWEFVRENLLKMLENPPEEFAQVLESLPPNAREILRSVICLDVFSECGRYVEVGDRETSLELIARKKDVARSLILAAELWTIILVGYCDILKTARKTAKQSVCEG
jgi:hypothetical protein